jgi:fatty-acyl-CoA synthase
MVREGFDPAVVADPLLFRDDEAGCYAPLDEALREQIVDGSVRV